MAKVDGPFLMASQAVTPFLKPRPLAFKIQYSSPICSGTKLDEIMIVYEKYKNKFQEEQNLAQKISETVLRN